MPFGSLGIWEVLLILLVLLLVFGAKRLPELGGALGKGIREFKSSIRDIEAELNDPGDERAGEISSGTRAQQSRPQADEASHARPEEQQRPPAQRPPAGEADAGSATDE